MKDGSFVGYHGKPNKKANALPTKALERIVAQMASLGTLTAARDNVLLQIGFFGGLRRSELVSIEVEYIARQAEGIAITLPRSKSDQLGKAIVKSIPYGARPCCAPASTPLASRPRQCSGRSASGASQPPRRCRGAASTCSWRPARPDS